MQPLRILYDGIDAEPAYFSSIAAYVREHFAREMIVEYAAAVMPHHELILISGENLEERIGRARERNACAPIVVVGDGRYRGANRHVPALQGMQLPILIATLGLARPVAERRER